MKCEICNQQLTHDEIAKCQEWEADIMSYICDDCDREAYRALDTPEPDTYSDADPGL